MAPTIRDKAVTHEESTRLVTAGLNNDLVSWKCPENLIYTP